MNLIFYQPLLLQNSQTLDAGSPRYFYIPGGTEQPQKTGGLAIR